MFALNSQSYDSKQGFNQPGYKHLTINHIVPYILCQIVKCDRFWECPKDAKFIDLVCATESTSLYHVIEINFERRDNVMCPGGKFGGRSGVQTITQ